MTAVLSGPGVRGAFHRLRVARVDVLCEDAAALTFDVPPALATVFSFRAGQSLTVRRDVEGREHRRSYSICAPAGSPPRIGVRAIADGAVSQWLVRQVRVGDEIEVQAPTGSFTPDLGRPARHVLIAAGSGITPVLSITATVLAHEGADATVIYGNRRAGSVMFADDVADLKDQYPSRLQLIHVLSREAQEVELFQGRLDAAKLRMLLPVSCAVADVEHWWLCGPFGMITDAITVLSEFGVSRGRIHRELFYVEDLPPQPLQRHVDDGPDPGTLTGADVTVVLDGRSSTVSVPAGTVILDRAQTVRPDLPFACRGGVCGTCRAQVTEGEVRMRRNFALEEAELAAGFVLTCQAVPLTDRVTVDYDA